MRSWKENAGADWVDGEEVVNGGLVTSRYPEDLAAFVDKPILSRGLRFHHSTRHPPTHDLPCKSQVKRRRPSSRHLPTRERVSATRATPGI
jgi:hypothetical protein